MGKVKEVYMDVQEEAWTILERNPSETLDNLLGTIASNLGLQPAFIRPIVEDVYMEYKQTGGVGWETDVAIFELEELNK